MSNIAQNIENIKEKIASAAKKAGRDPDQIKLIAVSKTKPFSDILEAVQAGQLVFGENYAQELRDKNKEFLLSHHLTISPSHEIEWHFLGHLQKNKLKYVLPVARWIHSVDSVELLEEMNKWLENYNSKIPPPPLFLRGDNRINALIEVNLGSEESKTGLEKEKVIELVKAFSAISPSHHLTISLRGLMCIPPNFDDAEKNRKHFKELKNLLDEINSLSIYPEKLTELSMGMTNDFEVAIEEGATMVRIGTAIFGERS